MKNAFALLVTAVLIGAALMGQPRVAIAETTVLTNLPSPARTITDLYKQDVYDASNKEIGEVEDVLLSDDGRVVGLIVGVGGFLGIGEKHVAVPYEAVKRTTKDGKVYLTLDAKADDLRAAPGFKYDRGSMTWIPETSK
jgi:sporulation protein YlmC with PRC-barrel domain